MRKALQTLRNRGRVWQARVALAYLRLTGYTLPAYQNAGFQTYNFRQPSDQNLTIPKTIWAYWNDTPIPPMVQGCLHTWYQHNPDYTIRVVRDADLPELLGELPASLHALSPQHRADWIRLALLHQYGGIWLDASIILTTSLAWILEQQARSHADFVGFYIQQFTTAPDYPVVESWFMAAPPNSPFIADVLDEFTNECIPRFGAAYLQHLQKIGIYSELVQNIYDPDYLNLHLCMQRVMRYGPRGYRLQLACAEHGPFFLHEAAQWNRHRFRALFGLPAQEVALPPLIKLRGNDRYGLQMCSDHHIYAPSSLLETYLTPQS